MSANIGMQVGLIKKMLILLFLFIYVSKSNNRSIKLPAKVELCFHSGSVLPGFLADGAPAEKEII